MAEMRVSEEGYRICADRDSAAEKVCEGKSMEKVFVNFTNHPSDRWGEKQAYEARKYGVIKDIPFPAVDPGGDEAYIEGLTEACVEKILAFRPEAVLCQGEFCLTYQVTERLREKGILVLAACSKRIIKETGRGKVVTFSFRQFRKYGTGYAAAPDSSA